jgi:hypothetical protein
MYTLIPEQLSVLDLVQRHFLLIQDHLKINPNHFRIGK